MANIKSIGGNPIVLGANGIADGSITLNKFSTALVHTLVKALGYATSATFDDADSVADNTIYLVTNTSEISNLPSEERGFLITIGDGTHYAATSAKAQIYLETDATATGSFAKKAFYRSRYGAGVSVWSQWSELGVSEGMIGTAELANGAVTNAKLASLSVGLDNLTTSLRQKLIEALGYATSATFADADAIEKNTIYWVSNTSGISNLPSDKAGCMITIGNGTNYQATAVTFQIYATYLAGVTTAWKPELYYRTRHGSASSTWSEWVMAGESTDTDFAGLATFASIGVLGDSYASGAIHFEDDVKPAAMIYEQSWPKNVERLYGCKARRYAYGGWGSYNFLNPSGEYDRPYGFSQLVTDIQGGNACGLYVIAFGINDSNSGKTFGGKAGGDGYIGSSADVNDSNPSANGNSFWGNMGRIIQTIKDESPDSLIVLTTCARTGSRYATYDTAIKAIGTYYGIPVLDLYTDPYIASEHFARLLGSHPTATMYTGMAMAVNRLMASDILTNWSYYRNYSGVEES